MTAPKHHMLFLFYCLLAVCAVSHGGTPGQRTDGTGGQRLYGGLNLSQWHEQLKNIDPKSSRAALIVEPLIEIVADERLLGVDREPFAAFLARVGDPARQVVPLLAAIIDGRHQQQDAGYLWAARALALMGAPAKEATPALVELLFDEAIPAASRQSPVEALALIGPAHPDAIPALLRLLRQRSSPRTSASQAAFLRQLAAESLALVGPEADIAAPLLIRIVRDPKEGEGVRRSAIVALGALESRGELAMPALREELLAGGSPALRDAAAQAIVRIGDASLPSMLPYLEHPDAEVRWRMASSLALRAIERVPATVQARLLTMLDDEHSMVRISAAEAAWKLSGKSDRVAATAIDLLSDPHRQIRIRAKNLLVAMKPLQEAFLAQLSELRDRGAGHAANSAGVVLKQLQREE